MSIRLFFRMAGGVGAAGTIISVASLFDILFNVGFGRLVDTLGYGVSIYAAAAGHGGVHHHLPILSTGREKNSRRTDGSALCGYAGRCNRRRKYHEDRKSKAATLVPVSLCGWRKKWRLVGVEAAQLAIPKAPLPQVESYAQA